MKNALDSATVVFAFACLVILLVFTVAALVDERSKQVVRLTVPAERLLSSVQAIQGVCYCVVSAIPLGEEDEAKFWRIEYNSDTVKR